MKWGEDPRIDGKADVSEPYEGMASMRHRRGMECERNASEADEVRNKWIANGWRG